MIGHRLLLVYSAVLGIAGGEGCGSTSAPPPPPCLAEQVTAGVSATWVLKADGTVWSAGLPTRRIDGPPSDTVRIGMRSDTMCLLSGTRELRCDMYVPTASTSPLPDVVRICMGVAQDPALLTTAALDYAVKSDGTLWIASRTGQPALVIQEAAFPTNVLTASAGRYQRCGVKTDGSLWCWGAGFLGDGLPEHSYNDPPQPARMVSLPASAVDVIAAANYTCALLDDATVWCWGNRAFGSVDRQGYPPFLSPVQVDIADVRAFVAGEFHVCAIKTDGSLWCWGDNRNGQSGFEPGGYAYSDTWETPRQVVALGNDVTQAAAGAFHTCARKSDATIWCWGYSSMGQVGNMNYVNATPVQLLGCE